MEGIKFDDDKLLWSLIPWGPMHEVAKVLTDGANKYTADNWKKVDADRYREALLRHTLTYQGGEINDPDSKSHHLAHVVANALIIMWHESQPEEDCAEAMSGVVDAKFGQMIRFNNDPLKLFTPEYLLDLIEEDKP